ncbi:hypothetical protein C1280_09150 [Gemmata obscuriglobus]|uniref:Uncharacterized protein n=1 Tax=Gemmata obscuriglobus TaxID=114 RepID=A0A2Z3GTS1_9BACT|nr:hypothetical protein C1280_09150 [Gemmata obscuriglobus]
MLLFGHRGAGKSALIGALMRAGEVQGETLRGEVVPTSPELPLIRDAAYSGTLESSSAELTSFTVRLRPWRVGTRAVSDPLTVILDDCDGKAAEDLIRHSEPITQRHPDSELARAVVETDAIVLLVDAASTRAQLAEAFKAFDAFLTTVERAKTDARTVGGFPVFLVLTQCDRLAQKGDTRREWEARVADRVDYAWAEFDEFLKEADHGDAPAAPFLSFGSIDLTVAAVALRPPPLLEAPTPADEPYLVAELFRDCFAAAKAHHERHRRSEARLWWTVRAALTALCFLVLAFGSIALFPPQGSAPDLAARVDDYELHEPPAAVRLSDPERDRNRQTLRRFANDAAFRSLSNDRRGFVESRLKEIDDYLAYRARLAGATAPVSARSLPDLVQIRETLKTALALPGEYSWGETAAAQLRDKWLADCAALEAAQQACVDRYRDRDRAGTELTLKRTFDAGWIRDLDALLTRDTQSPFPPEEPIPGSPELKQPRGEAITYQVPLEFDEVYRARRYWEQTRDLLVHLRDLLDALGLVRAPDRPPAVLSLPESGGADPAERLATLARTYPRQSADYAEWEAWRFPDPVRGEITGLLQTSFVNGVRHTQKLMRVEDTLAGWNALGATLAEPRFRDWGRFLHLLAKLQNPNVPDPVTELAVLLRDLDKKTFELDPRGFELAVPLDLTFERVEPVGPFTITVTHRGQGATAKFTVGKGTVRGTTTVYPLVPDGPTKLSYRAGDSLRAELPVRAGARELNLLWDTGPTSVFQFDRLTHEPRLTKPGGGTEPASGVKLVPTAGTVPTLPVLFPKRAP